MNLNYYAWSILIGAGTNRNLRRTKNIIHIKKSLGTFRENEAQPSRLNKTIT